MSNSLFLSCISAFFHSITCKRLSGGFFSCHAGIGEVCRLLVSNVLLSTRSWFCFKSPAHFTMLNLGSKLLEWFPASTTALMHLRDTAKVVFFSMERILVLTGIQPPVTLTSLVIQTQTWMIGFLTLLQMMITMPVSYYIQSIAGQSHSWCGWPHYHSCSISCSLYSAMGKWH